MQLQGTHLSRLWDITGACVRCVNLQSKDLFVETVRFPGLKKLKEKKNFGTKLSFLHKGPKKAVEQEYDTHFGQTLATKIRNGFLCSNLPFLP